MLHFLLNVVFGFLAGFLMDYILARCGVADPVKVIVAVLVGFIVFFSNLAAHVIQ